MNLTWVAHHEGETYEDTYRCADLGDEVAYQIPAALADDLETAQARLDAATTAIATYITHHRLTPQPISETD